jgi:hypothetical protein
VSEQERDRTPDVRRGRERLLSIRHPRVVKALAGINIDPETLPHAERFGNRLARDADAWIRAGGFAERGRISKGDAHRLFAHAFRGGGK